MYLKCINFSIIWRDMSFIKCRDTLQPPNSLVVLTLYIYFRNECLTPTFVPVAKSETLCSLQIFISLPLKGFWKKLEQCYWKRDASGSGDRLIPNQSRKPSNLASPVTSKLLTAMPLKDDAYPLFQLKFYLLSTQVASEGEGQIPGKG